MTAGELTDNKIIAQPKFICSWQQNKYLFSHSFLFFLLVLRSLPLVYRRCFASRCHRRQPCRIRHKRFNLIYFDVIFRILFLEIFSYCPFLFLFFSMMNRYVHIYMSPFFVSVSVRIHLFAQHVLNVARAHNHLQSIV